MARLSSDSQVLAAPPAPSLKASAPVLKTVSEPARSGVDKAGLLMLGLYIVSAYATDVMLLTVGGKPYLSTIAGIGVLLAFALSGRAPRAIRTKAGKLWLFMTVWLALDIPFSYWPGGSYQLLSVYMTKVHIVFFFVCALAARVEDCRRLMFFNVAGALVLVFECAFYGGIDAGGRFSVTNSMIFGNPNDVGLQLVFSMGWFVFLLLNKSFLSRGIGIGGLVTAFFYMLKTGSRGSLAATVVIALFCLLFTKYRSKVAMLAFPLTISLFFMPSGSLHRLTLIFLNPSTDLATASSRQDQMSIGSQIERTELLKASIVYMAEHPIFGIGPGEFSDFRWADLKQVGAHVASLGTHNSYTEIGAECGVPALICYAGVIIISIRSNYRLYKASAKDPRLHSIAQISLSLLLSCLGFAVNAFFHHSGYGPYVPLLGGLSAAFKMAAEPVLAQAQAPG